MTRVARTKGSVWLTTRPRPKPTFSECAPQGHGAKRRENDERKVKTMEGSAGARPGETMGASGRT
eukprot:970809-Prymnesium_polylepis.1